MESLPLAMPELTPALAAADRTTAPLLGLEPDDAPGATAAEPFAAVLALLTTAADGGDALPSSGNELPAEGVDPGTAGTALPLIAVPTAAPVPIPTATPRGFAATASTTTAGSDAQSVLVQESTTRTTSVTAPTTAPLPDPADTEAAQPITDAQAAARPRVAVPGTDVAEIDTPAYDASRASAEEPGQAAATARETGRNVPQPFAAWLQQRAADPGAQRDFPAASVTVTPAPAVDAARSVGDRKTTSADRLDGVARAASAVPPQSSALPQAATTRTNDAAIHVGSAAEPASAPSALHSASAALSAPAVQPAQAAASAPTGHAEPTAAMQGGSVDMAAPRWNEALAGRIQWLVDHELGEARIKLNPPELGALDVKIAVQDDKTYVQLAASSAAARDELAQSLPRLRELLSMGGLTLGGATVTGGGSDGGHPSAAADGAVAHAFEPAEVGAPAAAAQRPRSGAARIDLYA